MDNISSVCIICLEPEPEGDQRSTRLAVRCYSLVFPTTQRHRGRKSYEKG